MSLKSYLQILAAPLVVAGYGLFILRTDMSGWQGLIAGIAFTMAVFSAVISLALYYITKGQRWHDKTIPNLLTGVAGIGLALAIITIIARTG